MFSTLPKTSFHFFYFLLASTFCHLQLCTFNFDQSKILLFGTQLRFTQIKSICRLKKIPECGQSNASLCNGTENIFFPFPRVYWQVSLFKFVKTYNHLVRTDHTNESYSGQRSLTLYHTILTLNDPREEGFGNTVGKGENAGNQHFLLFPQCFLPFIKYISIFEPHLFYHPQIFSFWSKILLFGNV